MKCNLLKSQNYWIDRFSGFLENKGQKNNFDVPYYFSSAKSSIGFGVSKIYFMPITEDNETIYFDITFHNANDVDPMGLSALGHSTNYFLGDQQFVNLNSFEEIWYYDLYDKIDLRYYMNSQGLKYEFIVNPGGNPDLIEIKLSDNLELSVGIDNVNYFARSENDKPIFLDTSLFAFQDNGYEIQVKFVKTREISNGYGFEIVGFDNTQKLVIDPLLPLFSTYLGGEGSDIARGIAIDTSSNSYITGYTTSTDFPTQNPYQTNNDTDGTTTADVFVTKIVFDLIPPEIISPGDLTNEQGSTDNWISWNITDNYPDTYSIFLNGTKVANGSWNNETPVTINIDSLSMGMYNYTIVGSDIAGQFINDTVFVTVTDTTSPTINNPSDFSFEQGSIGNTISWTTNDFNPDTYIILNNSIQFTSGSWSDNSPITINVDGLSFGTYNFTIVVYDSLGNFRADTVIVIVTEIETTLTSTVIGSSTPITTTTTSTSTSEGTTMSGDQSDTISADDGEPETRDLNFTSSWFLVSIFVLYLCKNWFIRRRQNIL